MRTGPLTRLCDAARALPGPRDDVPLPLVSTRPAGRASDLPAAAPAELRQATGALLADLADLTEPALARALDLASRAWDQADALTVLDEALRARIDALLGRARAAATAADPLVAAAGTETLLVVGAAVGLVDLLERRLATLLRLRLGAGGELLPGGRPFLDVAAALREAARAWS